MKIWHCVVVFFHAHTNKHFRGEFVAIAPTEFEARKEVEHRFDLANSKIVEFIGTEHAYGAFALGACRECDPPKESGQNKTVETRKG